MHINIGFLILGIFCVLICMYDKECNLTPFGKFLIVYFVCIILFIPLFFFLLTKYRQKKYKNEIEEIREKYRKKREEMISYYGEDYFNERFKTDLEIEENVEIEEKFFRF